MAFLPTGVVAANLLVGALLIASSTMSTNTWSRKKHFMEAGHAQEELFSWLKLLSKKLMKLNLTSKTVSWLKVPTTFGSLGLLLLLLSWWDTLLGHADSQQRCRRR